eukprot:m.306629 g.306629  ORF g.306629 m.306629 type:complete len:490 (+) comp19623_c0_seq11:118-1587(+)
MSVRTLPPCRFAELCYRVDNPVHRSEYSHPCRYGKDCYQMAAAHRREFSHPKSAGATSSDGDGSTGSSPSGTWVCPACTLVNTEDADTCDVCEASRPLAPWICPRCTYANCVNDSECQMCEASRDGPASGAKRTRDEGATPSPSPSPAGHSRRRSRSRSPSPSPSPPPSPLTMPKRKRPRAAPKGHGHGSTGGTSAASSSSPAASRSGGGGGGGGGGSLEGLKVVFTGTFAAGKRKDVEGHASELGVHVGGAVSKYTDLVVVGSLVQPHGSKEQSAERLGIDIISEDDWDDMVAKAERRSHGHRHGGGGGSDGHRLGDGGGGSGSGGHRSRLVEDDSHRAHDSAARHAGAAASARAGGSAGGSAATSTPAPLHHLDDGESVTIASASSAGTTYKVKRVNDHYYCTCPAWRNQTAAVDSRTCRHLREYLGDAFETSRIGASSLLPLPRAARLARRMNKSCKGHRRFCVVLPAQPRWALGTHGLPPTVATF